MNNSTAKLAETLFNRFTTTQNLKSACGILEQFNQNQNAKNHAQNIIEDKNLTDGQKITQLLYLLRNIDHPLVYNFFSDILDPKSLWLFSKDKIDYFDRFVQEFQQLVDTTKIIYCITSVPLTENDYLAMIKIFKDGLGYRVLIDHQVNPHILGGVEVKIENYLFDYSLRSKFQQFQRDWLKSLDETSAVLSPSDLI